MTDPSSEPENQALQSIEDIIAAINALPEDVAPKDCIRIQQAALNIAQRRVQEDIHKGEDICPDCGGSGRLTTDGFQSANTECPRCHGDGKYHPHSSER